MPAPYRYASKLNRVKYHLYCQVVCEPTDEGCHKGYEQVCQWPRFELVDGDLDASRTPKERFALGSCPLEIQVETLELQTVDERSAFRAHVCHGMAGYVSDLFLDAPAYLGLFVTCPGCRQPRRSPIAWIIKVIQTPLRTAFIES